MKKIISIILCLVMIFGVFTVLPFYATAKEVENSSNSKTCGDYEYRILNDGTAEIVRYGGTDSDIVIPSMLDGIDVTSISATTFEETVNCRTITMSNKIKKIDERAFSCLNSLIDINVHELNDVFSSDNGVLYNKDGSILIKYPIGRTDTKYYINGSVRAIGNYAFEKSKRISYIDIPPSISSIGNSAFLACDNLKSVFIPTTTEKIGDKAFGYNDKSERVKDFTIFASKCTEAERYANDNQIKFVEKREPFSVLGDADKNGIVDITDATCIQKFLAHLIDDSEIDKEFADVDSNSLNIIDATYIQKFLVQLSNVDGTMPYNENYEKNPK